MMKQLSAEEALVRLQNQCVTGEMCMYEAKTKLMRWGIDNDKIELIVQKLVSGRFIDEQRYSQAFVNDKTRLSKWGASKIRSALQAKKIPPQLIAEALEKIDHDDQLKLINDLLRKKAKQIKTQNQRDLLVKLIRFGVSRGFDYNAVYRIAGEIAGEHE